MKSYYEMDISYYESVRIEIQQLFDQHLSATNTDVYFIHQEEYQKLPYLTAMLADLKITDPFYMIVIINDGESFDPHIDFYELRSEWSLLLPIRNTEKSYTTFHKCNKPSELISSTNHLNETKIWYKLDLDSCVQTDEIEIVRPTFINVRTPHGVKTMVGAGSRQTLSISLPINYNPAIAEPHFLKR